MKRNLILAVLCLLCALFLYGCGTAAAPEPSAAPVPAASPSVMPTASLPDENLEPDVQETEPVNEVLEAAKKYIDRPLSELIEEFGEPLSSAYVSSCLGPGQDGELTFDGFKAYTYKEGSSETVTYVEAAD